MKFYVINDIKLFPTVRSQDILLQIFDIQSDVVLQKQAHYRECSDSVVECLTQDRGAAGSSLDGVIALCP